MKYILIFWAALFLGACDFLEVDKCLDRGGRWNKEKQMCEYAAQRNVMEKPKDKTN